MPSERKRSETVDTVAKAILLSATEKVPISDTMRACGLKGDLTVVRNIYLRHTRMTKPTCAIMFVGR